jgi:phosphoglycerol transferase
MLNRNRLEPGSRHEVWLFIALTLACCVVLALTLRLWEADIRIPFTYAAGDQMYSNMVVKTVIETGWFHHNPALAAPTGRDLFEYFQPYGINFLLIRLLAVVADNNWVITLNLFILLSFFTATWSSWLLYRSLSLPAVFAGSAALLFAFLPYHFLRFNGGHLFLSSYFIAPLAIWLALRCASDDPPRFSIRHGWKELLVVFLLSNCGIYYALFGCLAILLGGTAGSIRRHAAKNLQISLAFILLCGLIILITMTPSLMYLIGGGTADFLDRNPAAAEVYGLKLVQLLMPINEHRIPLLAEISQQYAHGARLVNENRFASLGVIGGIGFLCLLIFFLIREPFLKISKQFEQLSLLNLGLFLFGTIGGFGMLLAGTFLPQIRGYNRISVYIACLSLAAAFLVLHYTSRRFLSYDSKPVAGSVIILALTTLGLLDTTSPSYVPAYPELAKRFLNDAAFVRKIEEQLPDNAMVFQTPHISLPEIVQHDMGPYRQLAGYLNSHRLRWSYGSARGSEDEWLKSVDMLLPERGIDDLEKAGFSGIYVERTGFSDHGAALESKLQAQLSLRPIESADGSLAFYPIDPTD